MAKIAIPLNDTQIKAAKSKDRNYSLFDGNGLFLEITKNGSKLWRLKYRSPVTNTDKKISLGKYPTVGIARARQKALEHRQRIEQGFCPISEKKKAKSRKNEIVTFGSAAHDWLDSKQSGWSDGHYQKQKIRIEKYIIPAFGTDPIGAVTDERVIVLIDNIQYTGYKDTGLRVFRIIDGIFKRLKSRKRIRHNPVSDIEVADAFLKPEAINYTAPTDEKSLKSVLEAIYSYESGEYATRMALKILPHIFLRSESLRLSEWNHIDFDAGTWTIPAANLKLNGIKKIKPKTNW